MIRVNGKDYDFPDPDSLTWGECKLLERVSGQNISQLFPADDLSVSALQAFVMIAVLRAEPRATEQEVMEALDKLTIEEMNGLLVNENKGTDAGPPVTPKNSGGPIGTSGNGTNGVSELSPAGVTPGFVGPPPSPTGATSNHET